MQPVAEWAVKHGLYTPHPSAVIRELTAQLARALREEYFTDPQGRRVRAKHVATVKQEDGTTLPLWDDMRTAPHSHMEIAFQQRRKQIAGDCFQLKTDIDSYNENRRPERPIQLCLDFTFDVAEREIMEGVTV
jgi:hypothetical protein